MPPDQILSKLNVPLMKDILAETKAVLLPGNETASTSMSLVGDEEFRRAWVESIPDDASDMQIFLEHMSSVKNTRPSKTVTDPMASQAVKKGLYRQVSVIKTKHQYPDKSSVHRNVLIQVLRKGYITKLVTDSNVDYTEARLHEGKVLHAGFSGYNTGSENYLMVKWNNVSPFNVKQIVDTLQALAVSAFAPVIKGVAYGTAFHRLHCDYRIEDDGSATIMLFLAHPEFTLYAFASWLTKKEKDVIYFWNVPKELAQGVLDLYKGKGRSATCSYNTNQALVDIIIYKTNFRSEVYVNIVAKNDCDSIMYADYYWGINDPYAYTIGAAPRGWHYDRQMGPDGDGGYDILVFRTQSQHRTYDRRWTSYSTLVDTAQYEQLGAPNEDYIPVITTVEAGGIYDQRTRVRDDCSLDIQTNYERGKAASLEGQRIRTGYLELMYRDRFWNKATATEANSDVVGFIYDSTNNLNRFGVYDSQETSRVARTRSVAAGASRNTALVQTTQSEERNATAQITAPNHAAGYIYTAQSQLNEFGWFDGGQEVRAAQAAEIGSKTTRNGVLAKTDTNVKYNQTAASEAGAATAGFIYDARNALNDFGQYDSATSTITANAVTFTNKHVESRISHDTYEDQLRNQTSAATVNEAVAGCVYDAQNSMNEFGLYDSRTQIKKAKSVDFLATVTRAGLATATQQTYRNNSSIITAPSPSNGQIYQASNELNAFGWYDGRLTNTLSVEASAYVTWDTRYGKAFLYEMKNNRGVPTSEIAALTSATNNSLSISLNQDKTYDAKMTALPHAWSGSGIDTEKYYYWRTKSLPTGKQLDNYIYMNTDLDKIYDWLWDTRDANLSGSKIDYLGGNKWRGVKVLEVA